ncbi:MAG: ATP-binding protein [Spirochaetales bacterium]|nr:ATP-binding protein [Spirochaetales bacterium]
MKKTIATVTAVVAAMFIFLTVVVTAILYHGVYEDNVRATLSEELDILSHLYETGNDIREIGGRNGRLTIINPDGSVEYDSEAQYSVMENHKERKEVKEAFLKGRGSDERQSDTLSIKQIYEAVLLSDGNVLRLSKNASTVIAFFSMISGPVVSLVVILLILVVFIASKASDYIVAPINALDLDNPEENNVYDEISPLLLKIARQKNEVREEIADKERTRKEFEFIISTLSEGLVVLGRGGRILSFNKSAATLLEEKIEDDKPFLAYLKSADSKELVLSALNGKDGETTFKVSSKILELSAYSSRSGGAVVLMRDITEKCERERMRKEFTANVSHELKTPITTIMGFSELLENPEIEREKVTDFASEINKEALRLRDIVGDIIELSSLDEGYKGENEEINVRNTVETEIKKLEHKADDNGVSVENYVSSSLIIIGIPKVFSEVISNLLDNAIRYNKKGGWVKVESKEMDGKVEISVSDNGIGIPKESIERVFERFYRVDKSRSRESGGTGLGLSIVKNGMERMGGEVRVESTQGEGSVFTLTFPLNH